MAASRPDSGFLRNAIAVFLCTVLAFALIPLQPCLAFAEGGNTQDTIADSGSSGISSAKVVTIGYYEGDPLFQNGFSDDAHKTGYAYELYKAIANAAGWTYKFVYGERKQIIQDLVDGKVDVVAGVSKGEAPKGSLLFSAKDMGLPGEYVYFAVNSKDEELLRELDDAIAAIQSIDPARFSNIFAQYYGRSNVENLLTPEEEAYLAEKKQLRFGYVINNLPLSGEDEKGEVSGISGELVTLFEEYLGVEMVPQRYESTKEMKSAIANGSCDAGFPIYSDYWISEQDGVAQTIPLMSDRVMIAYIGEYRDNLMDKVAVSTTALGQRYFIETNYPDSEMISYQFRVDALRGIQKGEANCIIGAASVLQRFMALHANEFRDFNVAYIDGSESFSIAFPLGDPMMSTIMNKAVMQADSSFISNALVKYSTVEEEYTVLDVIKKYSIWFVLFWVAIAAILAVVFVSYMRRMRKFNAEQAKAHEALEDALAAADAANEAKTSFLSSMSHDIRTPMNGIIGMSAIAAANIDNKERVEDCLAKIISSSKHLLALINEILDVSKIESGKIDLSDEVINLSEMIDDLMVINRPQSEMKKQCMTIHAVDVRHEYVIGDRVRLQQIFTNLVSNAIKYTPEQGSIDVTIVEKPSGSPKIGRYEFIVTDTGIGISEEYLPHVFEAFTRDDKKVVRKIQGTGLGMPIAQSLARMMNGDITVQSKLGEGSTFTVTVFLKFSDTEEASYEELMDLSVLVVDDERDVCESTCMTLREIGMDPEYSTSGAEAIKKVVRRNKEGDDYFAIIIDWVMPEMDGVETIKAIRERVDHNIPIIVVSAYDWSDIEYEARQAGAVSFIGKPLFKSRLVHMFSEILGVSNETEERGLDEITSSVSFKGRRALLAEDNELNAEIAIDFLGMTGLEMDHAIDGQQTVDKFAASEPGYYDCIFMDVQMPVMNGIEAAKAIREMDREDAKTIPIFAMTADAFVDDIKATRDAGMNEHFAKPIDFDEVVKTIDRYFKE